MMEHAPDPKRPAMTGRRAFLVGTALSSASVAVASQAASAASTAEASMASTRQFDFVSRINQAGYRVQVFVPRGVPTKAGFPVIYVLDGNALFGTFAEAMRNRSMASEIEPAVVVGISGGAGADRTFDFTSYDMTTAEKQIIKDLGPNPRSGGADAFLTVILDEVRPMVEALVAIDRGRSALFGWSLGGLFVVHAMFQHPDAFRTWLAISPSLWRHQRSVFDEIAAFEDRVAEGRAGPRFFLGVGGREEEVIPGMHIDGMTASELAAELRYCRMVGNASDLARTLGALEALPLQFRIFPGETHNSVPWSAVNPVLDFAFGRPGFASPP